MIKKYTFLSIIIILSFILAGCAAIDTLPNPTSLPANPPTNIPSSPTQPPPTIVPPTETPTTLPPTGTPNRAPLNPIPHYPTGQEFTITSIHMIDANNGWAIGGIGATVGDHIFLTADGANSWKDVTPPEEQPASDQHKAAIGYFQDTRTA